MCFDWVKNLKSPSVPQCIRDEENKVGSSAFALFWNMVRTVAPNEVLDDFDDFLHTLGIRRMDGGGVMPHDIETGRGDYTIEIPNFSFTFHGAELAPPGGVCARNYARYVLVLTATCWL